MLICVPKMFSKLTYTFILTFVLSGCTNQPVMDSSIFRMAIKNEPPTLDGTLATDSVSFTILTNLMEGLTQYDADLNPIPAIAKRWEYSNEGRTITFFLRKNVFWSDGKSMLILQDDIYWQTVLKKSIL